MAIEKLNELSDTYLDALSEVGNIGAGNAATSLSQMLNQMVKVSVPRVRVVDIDKVAEELAEDGEEIIGITIDLDQDLIGTILTVLRKPFANEITSSLLGQPLNDLHEIDTEMMIRSALQEIGNITAATYVNALAKLTELVINILTPNLSVKTAKELISSQSRTFREFGEKVVLIDESFIIKEEEYKSNMILMLELDSLNRLMNTLGIE